MWTVIKELQGFTMTAVEQFNNDVLRFTREDGRAFAFYHDQNCCEEVQIEDVCGNLGDLVGAPLLRAEERSELQGKYGDDSATWTFYEFATIKGSVTVRWLGTSNGFYSESVDIHEVTSHA